MNSLTQFLKFRMLPTIFGVMVFLLISMFLFNDRNIFMDKIFLCGLIIGMLSLNKELGIGNCAKSDHQSQSDLT